MVNYSNRVQNTTVTTVLVEVYLLSVLAAPLDEALPPPVDAAAGRPEEVRRPELPHQQ